MSYTIQFITRLTANIARGRSEDIVRILDAGCGQGDFIILLHKILMEYPDKTYEIHGFDVQDHKFQKSGSHEKTIQTMNAQTPGINWQERIKIITTNESWPFPRNYFDIVVSNQVLEHVNDLKFFLKEHSQILKSDGKGIHCFPTSHTIQEVHVLIPLAHRFKNRETLRKWLLFFYKLGCGQKTVKTMNPVEKSAFAASRADYILKYTNYMSMKELLGTTKAAGLHCNFSYTPALYIEKLKQLLSHNKNIEIKPVNVKTSIFLTFFLKYLGSIVVITEKSGKL